MGTKEPCDRSYGRVSGVVARKQVIVQLDDAMVGALDRLARKERVSRSELLRRAAQALLESYRVAQADRRLVESYRRTPQDPVIVETAARLAAETAPDW